MQTEGHCSDTRLFVTMLVAPICMPDENEKYLPFKPEEHTVHICVILMHSEIKIGANVLSNLHPQELICVAPDSVL